MHDENHTGPRRSPLSLGVAILIAAVSMVACFGDRMAGPRGDFSKIDGAPLNAARLAEARSLGQLCTVTGDRGDGTVQAAVFRRVDMPFKLYPVAPSRSNGKAPGRVATQTVHLTFAGIDRGYVKVSCIVPASVTNKEFLAAIRESGNSDGWRYVITRLRFTEPTTLADLAARETNEGREAFFEFVGAATALAQSASVTASGMAVVNRTANDCEQAQVRATPVGIAPPNDVCLDPYNVTGSADPWRDWLTSKCLTTTWCNSTLGWGSGGGSGGGTGGTGGGGGGGVGGWSFAGLYPSDQEAKLWSAAAHDSILRFALKETNCADWTQDLQNVSLHQDLDLNKTFDNKRHYLRDPGADPVQAKNEAEAWISFQLDLARQFVFNGDAAAAKESLGQAMHTMMDRTSPAHVDANGLPKEYIPVVGAITGNHSFIDFFGIYVGVEASAYLTDTVLMNARSALTAACDYALGG